MEIIKKIISFLGIVFDIKDIASLVRRGFSTGGATVVIIGTIKWIGENIPTLSLILFGIGLFMLLMALSPNVIRLFHRQGSVTQSNKSEWLERLAEQDLSELSQRIKIEITQLQFGGLKQMKPEFEIFVRITNTSVYNIRTDGHIGYILFAGSKWEPKFEPQKLLHGESKLITLRQTDLEKASDWLVEQANLGDPVNFVCSQYRLVFKVTTKGYEEGEARIPLREGGLPCIPQGNVLVSNNLVATVKG